MEQRRIRIVAVGDELLAGEGDPRALGWFGRVMARTPHHVAPVSAYNLA
ncbi:lysophospholipase, partial [Kocuria sp. CPCC 205292]